MEGLSLKGNFWNALIDIWRQIFNRCVVPSRTDITKINSNQAMVPSRCFSLPKGQVHCRGSNSRLPIICNFLIRYRIWRHNLCFIVKSRAAALTRVQTEREHECSQQARHVADGRCGLRGTRSAAAARRHSLRVCELRRRLFFISLPPSRVHSPTHSCCLFSNQ